MISRNIPSLLAYHFPGCCCECILSDVHSHDQHTSLLLVIYIWQQLLLSHETGTHWITIHMTVQASTIGCEPSIKQLHTAALGDPLGRPLGRDP